MFGHLTFWHDLSGDLAAQLLETWPNFPVGWSEWPVFRTDHWEQLEFEPRRREL